MLAEAAGLVVRLGVAVWLLRSAGDDNGKISQDKGRCEAAYGDTVDDRAEE